MAEVAVGIDWPEGRRIREAFEQTFEAAARNFQDVVQHLFPGGRGALRLVHEEMGPRPVVGGESLPEGEAPEPATPASEAPVVTAASDPCAA